MHLVFCLLLALGLLLISFQYREVICINSAGSVLLSKNVSERQDLQTHSQRQDKSSRVNADHLPTGMVLEQYEQDALKV